MKRTVKRWLALALGAALLCCAFGALAENMHGETLEVSAEASEASITGAEGMLDAPEDVAVPLATEEPQSEDAPEDMEAFVNPSNDTSDIPSELSLGVGESYALPLTGKGLSYKSSARKVATVSKKGVVKAKAKGEATITVSRNGAQIGSCNVKVLAAPDSIVLSPSQIDIYTLSSDFYKAGYRVSVELPENTASQIYWSSSNEKVATVNDGTIYGYRPGVAKITATTFNGHKAVCVVKVIGDEIPINATFFPDKAFRQFVKKYDLDDSGAFSNSELAAVRSMKITCNAKSLIGLQYFGNVTSLVVACGITELKIFSRPDFTHGRPYGDNWIEVNSNISKLDVSGCTKLKNLEIYTLWYLKTLKLGGKKTLENLSIEETGCSSVTISGFEKLKNIMMLCNYIDSLTVNKCPAVEWLDCREGRLKQLTIGKNSAPQALACGDNQLKALDLHGQSGLFALWCDHNQLKTLNITNCKRLNQLDCTDNDLKTLSLKGCTDLKSRFGSVECDPGVKITK